MTAHFLCAQLTSDVSIATVLMSCNVNARTQRGRCPSEVTVGMFLGLVWAGNSSVTSWRLACGGTTLCRPFQLWLSHTSWLSCPRHVCHIIWVLGMESCWCPGYQCPKLFMYPPECTGAPLVAMPMSHNEHGEDEEGSGGARWSPSGPHGPFFMIFLNFDRLFWNQIFTWQMKKEKSENY